MRAGLGHRLIRPMLTAGIAVVLVAGAACGDGAQPAASSTATPLPQATAATAPRDGRTGGAGIALTHLMSVLGPALGGANMGEQPQQVWEEPPPGQGQRLLALLPERVSGLEPIFEGTFRTRDEQGEALAAMRLFLVPEGAELGAAAVTVAVQPLGALATELEEWQGHGLSPKELATLMQVLGDMFQGMGIQVRQATELDIGAVGEASLGLRLRLVSESEEMLVDMAAARRKGVMLIAGVVTAPGVEAPDAAALLREMDRRAAR